MESDTNLYEKETFHQRNLGEILTLYCNNPSVTLFA